MKERPILIIATSVTLIVEVILMVLVYNKIGSERIPKQIVRIIFQLILILIILSSKSNVALFLLTAFHIVSGIIILNSDISSEFIGKLLIFYHFGIGVIIYFHEWLEEKLIIKTLGNNQYK